MPGPAPQPPAALNLRRLSQVTPNQAVTLPGTLLRAVHLTAPCWGQAGGAAICLDGELLIDFADGAFVLLRPGEACALPLAHQLRPARGHCTALLSNG
ncbi:hypothetical protein [Deinococcus sp.]|uniref:hypothetical protein n=1 Tax=Deinococcus sp. TaxID=47478 RepID=UPI003B591AEC